MKWPCGLAQYAVSADRAGNVEAEPPATPEEDAGEKAKEGEDGEDGGAAYGERPPQIRRLWSNGTCDREGGRLDVDVPSEGLAGQARLEGDRTGSRVGREHHPEREVSRAIRVSLAQSLGIPSHDEPLRAVVALR